MWYVDLNDYMYLSLLDYLMAQNWDTHINPDSLNFLLICYINKTSYSQSNIQVISLHFWKFLNINIIANATL